MNEGFVSSSPGKAVQWRGSGRSSNRQTLKTEKLLSSSPSRKSALTILREYRCDTPCCAFQKQRAWNPYFYSVFWVRVFWAKVSKKIEKPPRKMEKFDWWTENLFFGIFAVFFGFFFSLFFWFLLFVLFFFCVFFGGFKGQVRWPKGPPHLALNPPYFFSVFFFVFFFLEGLRVRWGGPKGHLTWP